jgi:hypothetical protein
VLRAREPKREGGRATRTKLYLISLAKDDRGATVLQDVAEDLGATGRGMSRTYRLDKPEVKPDKPDKDKPDRLDNAKGPRDIVAAERRPGCAEVSEQRFTLDDRHYRSKSVTTRC